MGHQENRDEQNAIIGYIVTAVIIFILARYCRITIASSLVLAALAAPIVMMIICPYYHVARQCWPDKEYYPEVHDDSVVYLALAVLSLIIISVYVVIVAVGDVQGDGCAGPVAVGPVVPISHNCYRM
jgi:hypothetical protein